MILLEKQQEARKTHDHQNTFARNIPFQRTVTEQVGSKLFPLSTIIFTLDVPVIIINV